jgi:hypothetical protein
MKPRKKEKKEKERKLKKNRELRKSTQRDGGLINSEQDKYLERKKKKIPGSGTIEFQF